MVAPMTSGDGFDMYNGIGVNVGIQARWYLYNTGAPAPSMVTGRFGGQGFSFNSSGHTIYIYAVMANSAPTAVAFAADVYFDNLASGATNDTLLSVCRADGTLQCGLRVSVTGQVVAYNASGVLGTSAAGVIVSGTWHRIEGEITLNASSGSINVYLDQPKTSPVTLAGCTVSGVNTLGAGSGGGDIFRFGGAGGTCNCVIDNFLYNNASATRMGPLRAETLRPNGNSSVAWTPSTGSNYSCVNGTVVNGTTFVETATVSAVDKYTITPLSLTPSEIDAVNVVIFAQKTDAGGRSVDAIAVSGSTEEDGSTVALATNYQRYDPNLMTVDPNTSSAWAPSAVNALLIGPKLAA